jgi:TolB-like protein/DNA-binding winged helix-turn-helix (wHTH) protein/Flp pilus assembly protein TadD
MAAEYSGLYLQPMALEAGACKPRIDVSRYELSLNGKRVKLERQPMDLLIFFVRKRDQLVTREEIIDKLWGKDVFVDTDRSINSAVRKLRTVLGDDPARPHYLETVVGKGYRFIGDVDVVGLAPARVVDTSLSLPAPLVAPAKIGRVIVAGAAMMAVLVAAVWGWLRWRQSPASASPQIRSIAVLPLANLSGDPAQEYFADGMTDELITEIAQVGSLRVTSRTSSMRYKATAKTAPEIAKELNVDAVLEGSVARSGERVRITAQLIDARADKHLWANTYETEQKDVLGMEDAVARDVAKQIRLRLTAQEQERLSRSRPVNPQAHEAYLKGLYQWNKRDRAGLEQAIEYFNQAIAIDPNYALPYAGLAQCYVPLTYFGYLRGTEARAKVAAALERALELDDSLAEAHTALGSAKSYYDYDWAGAEKEFRRAIELNPNYATAHQWYAQMLNSEGRGEEALTEHRRALELDPLSLIINSGTGHRLYRLRRYDQAAASLNAAVQLDPGFPSTHWNLGLVYAQQKNFPAAIAELRTAEGLFHDENAVVLGGLGYAYGASGDKARAQAILRHLERRAGAEYVDPYAVALVYAGLKNKDKAFAWLEKAYADRDCWVTFLNAEPALDGLRPDPRFQDLLRRMSLAR